MQDAAVQKIPPMAGLTYTAVRMPEMTISPLDRVSLREAKRMSFFIALSP